MFGAKIVLVLVVTMMAVSLDRTWAAAQMHHVVGGDRGWDSSSDVASWSAGRVFRIGDKIWFAYSAAQESIAELKSKEEYESCDVRNPIRMYTDGLDGVPLDGEGIRYFVSSKPDNCKKGLKLHVEVMPKQNPQTPKISTSEDSALALAAGPIPPSGSTQFTASFVLVLVGLGLFCMGM
ncbi:Early nodulin-like protein 1 [Melia azedarach]|uniref:Early nodulin-like protein 1 n=1 Tax=Melia azedarach TaxID=155640 RepID=A0ACC1WYM1_MELAZ|nr:Early nodulin-like protein 1 [Melia azedarach]